MTKELTPYSNWVNDQILISEFPTIDDINIFINNNVVVYLCLIEKKEFCGNIKKYKNYLIGNNNTKIYKTNHYKITEIISKKLSPNIYYIHFPIRDGYTHNDDSLIEIIYLLNKFYNNNLKLLVHCMAGIGRTGVIVGGLLISIGHSYEKTLEIMREKLKNRKNKNKRITAMPHTQDQFTCLRNFELKYKKFF